MLIIGDPRNVPALKREEWEPAAVDFHCSNIQELVLQHCSMSSSRQALGASSNGRVVLALPPEVQFKDLMWHCSSAITDKTGYLWAKDAPPAPTSEQTRLWAGVAKVAQEQAAAIVRQKA